jgi:hypothetical protein
VAFIDLLAFTASAAFTFMAFFFMAWLFMNTAAANPLIDLIAFTTTMVARREQMVN